MTWSLMTSPPSSYIIPASLPLLQPHWGLFSFTNTFCMCSFRYLEWPSSDFLKPIYLSALSSSTTSSVLPTFNLLMSYPFLYSAYLSSWWDIYLYCYLVNTCLAQAPQGQYHFPSCWSFNGPETGGPESKRKRLITPGLRRKPIESCS